MHSKATVLCIGSIEPMQSKIATLKAWVDVYFADNSLAANSILKQEWVQVALICGSDNTATVQIIDDLRQSWPDVRLIAIGQDESAITPLLVKANNERKQNICDNEDFGRSSQGDDSATSISYIHSLFESNDLKHAIFQQIELFKLSRENQRMRLELSIRPKKYADEVAHQRKYLQAQSDWDQGIVRSANSSMNGVCEMIEHVGPFDVNVIFTGESGTGKELCAKAIHLNSLRRQGPFIAENCGAMTDELLASELFGHKKGAFTGATSDNIGLFEQADGGTLFLDEVGELSESFQVKLLRVLQEGEIRPVGSNKYKSVDVRIVAATNRDLAQDVKSGKFREDLYYRLATFVIDLPALRERQGDITTIAQVLLQDCMNLLKKRVKGFAQSTLEMMQQYHWPGNIRELQNEIKRMLVLCGNEYLTPNLLSAHIQMQAQLDNTNSVSRFITLNNTVETESQLPRQQTSSEMLTGSLKDRVESLEAKILEETLQRHRWNKTRAASELGLSRVGLRNKLERYELSNESSEDTAATIKQSSNSSRNVKS